MTGERGGDGVAKNINACVKAAIIKDITGGGGVPFSVSVAHVLQQARTTTNAYRT